MKRIVRLAAYAAVGFASGGLALAPAQAAVVVDQSSLVMPEFGWGYASTTIGSFTVSTEVENISLVQSFTAGKTGYLDHLDFQLFPRGMGKLTLSLFDGDFASGGATLVSSAIFDAASLPSSPSFDESSQTSIATPFTFDVRGSGFLVTPGKRYSVSFDFTPEILIPNRPQLSLVIGKFQLVPGGVTVFNDYTGGERTIFSSLSPEPWVGSGDVGFRSFVDETATAAVPEPASWAMMIGGFALAGGALRRRRVGAEVRFA